MTFLTSAFFHPQDLPGPLMHTPNLFRIESRFRRLIRKIRPHRFDSVDEQ
jgi:hypothetical protein